ncbi:MAG: lysylphosphatidylglycerol synthase transmembrane domain-containing protein [Candidatus Omnitrophota bacterium]|nr:lysylphosphatidylglycerol synthase transmembrane domain-containing protein [Candidatus Omnitrophota bacterium]MDZ4241478.1 lysylphosphatidylglycerol synthase transmembrane domain-containing protein [Candidatus Omnitrophota bacterium]
MDSSTKRKDIVSALLRFGVSGALLYWLSRQIDVDKTTQILRSSDLADIAWAGLIFLFVNYLILVRWNIFVRAFRLAVPFSAVARYFLIGLFGNLFLPSAIGGDVIKIFGLCRYTDQKAKVVASVLLDRMSGFGGIVVVSSVSFVLGYKLLKNLSLAMPLVVLAGISLVMLSVLFNERLYSLCCSVFSPFPNIRKKVMALHYDVVLLKDRKDAIYKAVGMSCVVQVILAVIWFLTGRALGQDVGFVYYLIFVPIICVSASIPSVAGLGTREAAAVFLLGKVGVEAGVAVSISLISSMFFMVVVGLAGGLVFLLTKAPQEKDLKPPVPAAG